MTNKNIQPFRHFLFVIEIVQIWTTWNKTVPSLVWERSDTLQDAWPNPIPKQSHSPKPNIWITSLRCQLGPIGSTPWSVRACVGPNLLDDKLCSVSIPLGSAPQKFVDVETCWAPIMPARTPDSIDLVGAVPTVDYFFLHFDFFFWGLFLIFQLQRPGSPLSHWQGCLKTCLDWDSVEELAGAKQHLRRLVNDFPYPNRE